jgi:protein-tyrosine phosphatase
VKLRKPLGGSDYVNASPIVLKTRSSKQCTSGTSTPVSNGQSSHTSDTRQESRYIATQGPKEGQFSHFWHMVMQETPGDTAVIIQLTQHFEGNKEKCAQYYPSDLDDPTMMIPAHEEDPAEGVDTSGPQDDGDPFLDSPAISADADSLTSDSSNTSTSDLSPADRPIADPQKEPPSPAGYITLLSSTYSPTLACQIRTFALVLDDTCKTVHHYFFTNWPDFGKPEAEDRVALLELCRVSRKVAQGDGEENPRIVHCSAGVGRTGTWIALDFLVWELENDLLAASTTSTPPTTTTSTIAEQSQPEFQTNTAQPTWGKSGPPKSTTPDPQRDEEDRIWDVVNTLREQRMMMVMNELQYQFLYEVVREAFIARYAEKEMGPVIIGTEERGPKVARKKSPEKGGNEEEGDEGGDGVGDEEAISEAETEIMERDGDVRMKGEAGKKEPTLQGNENDPYAAVAPDTIRQGMAKGEQDVVRGHENQ